jgi:hypothetical protein
MRPNPQNKFFTTKKKNKKQFYACLAYLKLNSFPTCIGNELSVK